MCDVHPQAGKMFSIVQEATLALARQITSIWRNPIDQVSVSDTHEHHGSFEECKQIKIHENRHKRKRNPPNEILNQKLKRNSQNICNK